MSPTRHDWCAPDDTNTYIDAHQSQRRADWCAPDDTNTYIDAHQSQGGDG